VTKLEIERARIAHLLGEYERRTRLLKARLKHVLYMEERGEEDRIQPLIEGINSWKADEIDHAK